MANLGGSGYVWPDSSGTATDPTTSFVASSTLPILDSSGRLLLSLAVTAASCRAVLIKAEISFNGTDYTEWQRKAVLCGATGTYYATLDLPKRGQLRLSAARVGGSTSTRLSISALAKPDLGDPGVYGQPLELASHQPDGVECWGDGSGAAAAMAAGPDAHVPAPSGASAQQWLPVGEADTLVIDFTTAVAAPDTVELEVRERLDGTNTVEQVAVNSVSGGVIEQQIAQEQLVFGAVGTRRTREISVRPGSDVLVLGQYTGGGGGTTGYGIARFYKLGRS